MNNFSFNRTFGTKESHPMYRPQVPSCEQIHNHFEQAKQDFESTFSGISFATMDSQQKEDAQNYLYRSQIIMAYSAFDLFMHEILYLGFFKMNKGFIAESEAYKAVISEEERRSVSRFNSRLNKIYGRTTLTSDKWGEVLTWLGFNSEDISKAYLEKQGQSFNEGYACETIVNKLTSKAQRRNKLVHAYDFNIPGGTQNSITQEQAKEYIEFITSLVNTVYEYVRKEWN